MATSTTLIAGNTLGLNPAQTSAVGGGFTLQSYSQRFAADYNGDGKVDIVGLNGATSAMVMLGNGDGTFGAAQTAVAATANTVYLAEGAINPNLDLLPGSWGPDFNGDALTDNITATTGATSIDVQFGNSATTHTYAIGHAIADTALADVTGDGTYDLIVANGDNTVSVLQYIAPASTTAQTSEDTAMVITLAGYNTTGASLSGFQLSALSTTGTVYLDAALTQAVTTAMTITASSDMATVYFKPNANWNGSTSIQYVAVDAAGNTSATPATQNITVAAVNDVPTLGTATTLTAGAEDTAYTVTAAQLLTGWTDADGTPLSIVGNTVTADHGTVAYNAAASSYTVTPTANYNGPVTLSYSVTDGVAPVATTLGFTLAAVNDLPTLGTAAALTAGAEDTPYTVSAAQLLIGWTDIDGTPLSIAGNTVTADHGTVSYDAATSSYTVTPDANYSGPVTLSYSVTDGTASVATTLGFTLAAVNDVPTLGSAATLTAGTEDSAYTVTAAQLLTGWTDVDGNVLSIAGNTVTADHGTVSYDAATSSYTVTPAANYNGLVTLSYSVTDGVAPVAATQSFTLAAVNDAPTLGTAATLSAGTEDSTYTVTVAQLLTGWTDIDGNTLSIVGNTVTADHGSVSYDAATSSYTVTPDANYNGSVTLSYSVTDGISSTAAILGLGLDTVNDAPVLTGGTASLNNAVQDTAYLIQASDLLQGYTDVDGDALTVANLVADHGTLTDNQDGTFTLSPEAGYDGNITLGYTVTDNHGSSIEASQSVGVTPNSTVTAAQNYTLPDSKIDLVLTGSTGHTGTGNTQNNHLTGSDGTDNLHGLAGDDTIDGGMGADTMDGGVGNDTYYVDNSADRIVESASEGIDTVYSSGRYTLNANLENLVLLAGTTNGGGNDRDNLITGNATNNLLAGGAGNDTLDGGTGTDTLYGGTGNDTFRVDSQADRVIENTDEGTDSVISSVNHGLSANIENLTLTGSAINGGGNSLDNLLIGNSLDNLLAGNAGNDTLDGGTGADTLYGGTGNDTFHVDSQADRVIENTDEGIDSVISSINHGLSANIENLTLTGLATNGGGNSLDNVLTGNSLDNLLAGGAGNDTLDGGTGADTLYGGTGNDTYFVDSSGDRIVENASEGIDTVVSSVNKYTLGTNLENLTLAVSTTNGAGNALDNILRGNANNNVLDGKHGNDTLIGGLGNDVLAGGAGADQFVFDTAPAQANADLILDFTSGTDKIVFDSAVYTALGTPGQALDASILHAGTGFTTAAAATDHLIFNTSTGALYYDADGAGGQAATLVASLSGVHALSASDFFVS